MNLFLIYVRVFFVKKGSFPAKTPVKILPIIASYTFSPGLLSTDASIAIPEFHYFLLLFYSYVAS